MATKRFSSYGMESIFNIVDTNFRPRVRILCQVVVQQWDPFPQQLLWHKTGLRHSNILERLRRHVPLIILCTLIYTTLMFPFSRGPTTRHAFAQDMPESTVNGMITK